jgi:hypothetical protein
VWFGLTLPEVVAIAEFHPSGYSSDIDYHELNSSGLSKSVMSILVSDLPRVVVRNPSTPHNSRSGSCVTILSLASTLRQIVIQEGVITALTVS